MAIGPLTKHEIREDRKRYASSLAMLLRIHFERKVKLRSNRMFANLEAEVAKYVGRPLTSPDAWEWLLDDYIAEHGDKPGFYGSKVTIADFRQGIANRRAELAREKEEFLARQVAERAAAEAAKYPGHAEFYSSVAWRQLRYKVIAKSKGCCEACHRSTKAHGIVLHVDHIMPRSEFPDLALEETNLQVLCEDCNLGKGVSDTTDWRAAKTQPIEN